jgi:hypothetical protein
MKLAQEKPGQTLQTTALVGEAYVRLVTGPVRSLTIDPQRCDPAVSSPLSLMRAMP